ncbi:MAG: trehalose-phosphatase [Phycisphaerales bacterium]|nr:trehalose-phosphatase [Phycisphaerales bacterium]MCB9862632.1 trehalose-phosphatase [Phycisphaerales bacterium]
MTQRELDGALEALAIVPVLLVASDYDGTIAPIVTDPAKARPHREAVVALRALASLPQTHVAVISGRALGDLARLTGMPEDVHLVGSHGSEFDLDFATSIAPEAAALQEKVKAELESVASAAKGFQLEVKPASIAFHYRNADRTAADSAVDRILNGAAKWNGVYTKHGKEVVELGVVKTDKGTALARIRHLVGASAVLFLGDDVTDEDAFVTLHGPDIGVKIGDGESAAAYRVEGPIDVARVLARLSELRSAWLAGSKAVAIERHSLLSDQRTIALVTPTAKISWLCTPRIDSPALFADLLGGPAAGHFSISPAGGGQPISQEYQGKSLVLKTSWRDFSVTDFLDCSAGRPGQRAGRSDLVRVLEGDGRVRIEFAPRLDFGRVPTDLTIRDGGLIVEDTLDPIVLRSPGVEWRIESEGCHQTAIAEVELNGEAIALELRYGTGSVRELSNPVADRLLLTQSYWSAWADRLRLPSVAPEFVERGALVLKALCYGPTGAIAAAGTTSLPEHIGGVRNWDYRYCWLRDAAMSAATLVKLGSTTEAMEYLDWLLGIVDRSESPERLSPLYGVAGETLGIEADVGELSGYCGSRPVRVGNSAARQIQLDVFGPNVELVALLSERDAPLSSDHWRLVEAMVRAVEKRWHEPDHGIWEIRKPRRHHVHSKVMCWMTVDRAIHVANRFLDRDREDWRILRDQIAADVLQNGYKANVRAFTAAYDGEDLDASALAVGISGLLPPDDERFAGTVEAVEKALSEGPTVYRYRADDGLPGVEGGFFICASWLIDAYILLGEREKANDLFSVMLDLVGPTWSLSEQYDPPSGRALGNVPQAYSYIGLIENALRLSE